LVPAVASEEFDGRVGLTFVEFKGQRLKRGHLCPQSERRTLIHWFALRAHCGQGCPRSVNPPLAC
jgi:hypothetical protein